MKITNPKTKRLWAAIWYWWPLVAVLVSIVWLVDRAMP